jgi:uncharacterized damage-inducible protein DinB
VSARAERLDILRTTLGELPRAVGGVQRSEDESPGAGGWSLREVLAHLADAELVYGLRLRLLVGVDNPRLEGYDQERWAERFTALETVTSALERWRVQREANLRLLESLSEAEWFRTGTHTERGVESVEDQLVRMSDHDVGHLRQLHQLT